MKTTYTGTNTIASYEVEFWAPGTWEDTVIFPEDVYITDDAAQATELLTDVLSKRRRQGGTWRMLAIMHKQDSPQAMKRLAKDAARISQRFLLEQKRAHLTIADTCSGYWAAPV